MVCSTNNPAAELAFNEGGEQAEQQNLAEAEQAYLAAIREDPSFCDAMDNLAILYRRSGRADKAIPLYEQSLAIAPHNEVALQNLGVAYSSVQRLDDALRAYGKLTELKPQNPEGWFGQGNVFVMSGRYGEAIASLRRAEQLYVAASSPYLTDVRLLIGLAAAGLSDWKQVRAVLTPLYDQVSHLPEVNLYLGLAYAQPDALEPQRARVYLERARAQGATVDEAVWQRVQEP
ncbi:MAG: tetratricopeptide repeat protein [Kofleriaceae bacterium]